MNQAGSAPCYRDVQTTMDFVYQEPPGFFDPFVTYNRSCKIKSSITSDDFAINPRSYSIIFI